MTTVDILELIAHEEGRLRPKKIDSTLAFTPANLTYIYDHFLKDHLGNVRSVITTETKPICMRQPWKVSARQRRCCCSVVSVPYFVAYDHVPALSQIRFLLNVDKLVALKLVNSLFF